MPTYEFAQEVKAIAAVLIRDVEQHKPLADARIEYVWRDKASKSNGRVVLGKARKVSGLNAFLIQEGEAEDLFVVEIAADTWGRLELPQRRALVDHELCHLRVDHDDDGMPVLSMRGHDLEEFACIVERYGLWKSDVAAFGTVVAEQLVLAIEEASQFVDELTAPDDDPEADPPPSVDALLEVRYSDAQVAALNVLAKVGEAVASNATDEKAGTIHHAAAATLLEAGLIRRVRFDDKLREVYALTDAGRQVHGG